MATKKTAKKAQPKASSKKPAPVSKPSTKTASKASGARAPAAKEAAKAPRGAKPSEASAVRAKASKTVGKSADIKKGSAAAKKVAKKVASKASVETKKVTKKAAPKASVETKKVTKKAAPKASVETKKVTKKAAPKTKAPKKPAPQAPSVSEAASEVEQGVHIAEGDAAPSFVLKDDTGVVISSESLRGSPYVLYFYPKDDTPGCTLEACGFRDSLPRFNAKGVRVIGVSPDSPEAHTKFKKKYDLTFSLLSDPEKTLAKAYGVWVKKQNYGREYMGVERSTFVVDKHGTVEKVWRGVKVPGHVDAVLDSV